jgi:acetyl-CoA acetyltransferase
MLDSGKATEKDFAEVAARSRKAAAGNAKVPTPADESVSEMMAEDYIVSPLRKHAVPPISDGAAAVVLAAGDRASELCSRPAWIAGFDHRIETHAIGARDLSESPSTRLAAEGAGLGGGKATQADVVELHAPFAHQELILCEALGIDPSAGRVAVNPSGGALAANSMMVAGLIRLGEAATRVMDGSAHLAVAHATSGPCLQQNLICALADEPGPLGAPERSARDGSGAGSGS